MKNLDPLFHSARQDELGVGGKQDVKRLVADLIDRENAILWEIEWAIHCLFVIAVAALSAATQPA